MAKYTPRSRRVTAPIPPARAAPRRAGPAGTAATKPYDPGYSRRKLLALASILAMGTPVVVLDEPMSGLDPIGRKDVRDLIVELQAAGKTVFFSSHELGEVETICDRVAILNQGELKAEGRVDALVRRHQCNLEQVFLRIVGYAAAA